jgi:glycosyltransferase involved in cell wall biosynthesis
VNLDMANNLPRVLHVLGALNRGGVETWLMNLIRTSSRSDLPIEVCLLSRDQRIGDYEQEYQQLGGTVHRCPLTANLWSFSRRFRKLLQEGQFDIVHSHVHLFSGYILKVAAEEGVRGRIAHSHSDTRSVEATARLLRRMYGRLMRYWLGIYANRGLACSEFAAAAMFGARWKQDSRIELLKLGIDLTPFKQPPQREAVRHEIGLAEDEVAIIHVGRLAGMKNHRFLLDVAEAIGAIHDRYRMLFVGGGELEAELRHQIEQRCLSSKVTLLGPRPDVPRLLRAADVFVLPSLYEGHPVSAIEAQAAGLPCVLSDTITPGAAVGTTPVMYLGLARGAEAWARTCLELANQRPAWSVDILRGIQNAGYSQEASRIALIDVYKALAANQENNINAVAKEAAREARPGLTSA